MLKIMKNIVAAVALVLVFVPASFAQQPNPNPTPQNNPNANRNPEANLKSQIFDVKYRDTDKLAQVLRGLGSRAASVFANAEFKTITVRDFPENLVVMEEALKRLDVPLASRPNIELHMHVLIASNAGGSVGGGSGQVPDELKDVLVQLRETLSYKKYELATSVVQRLTTEMSRIVESKGSVEISSDDARATTMVMPYQFDIQSVSLAENTTGGPTVQVGVFRFTAITDKDRAQVETALNFRDGEKVVVGTATFRNRALVIVLIAKLIK